MAENRGVALVTGASGVIGAAIARELDGAGFHVAVLYNDGKDRARDLAASLANRSLTAQLDVTDWTACRDVVSRVEADLGSLDAVVNCGGVRHDGLLAGQSPEDWRHVIDVNLVGAFHVIRAALPPMLRRRRGAVVNIVSPIANLGNPGQTAYAASKAGLVGMTRSLAREVAKRGITVNAVSPGFVETPMTEGLGARARDLILERAAIKSAIPADDVARAVLFVMDNRSMTGQMVSVDGGVSA